MGTPKRFGDYSVNQTNENMTEVNGIFAPVLKNFIGVCHFINDELFPFSLRETLLVAAFYVFKFESFSLKLLMETGIFNLLNHLFKVRPQMIDMNSFWILCNMISVLIDKQYVNENDENDESKAFILEKKFFLDELLLKLGAVKFIFNYTLNEKAGVIIPCKTNEDHINVSVSILDKDTIEDLVRWIPRAMNIDKDISFFTNKVDLAENFKD